jgi:hypothetical protein
VLGKLCETNPICRLPHRDRRDRSRETKPVAPGSCWAGTPSPRRAEGLSCETNPILPVDRHRGGQNMQNKPNSRRGRSERGHGGVGRRANVQERTQFRSRDGGQRRERQPSRPKYPIPPGCQPADRGQDPVVRNEANSRSGAGRSQCGCARCVYA